MKIGGDQENYDFLLSKYSEITKVIYDAFLWGHDYEESEKVPNVSDIGAIGAIISGHRWCKSQHFLNNFIGLVSRNDVSIANRFWVIINATSRGNLFLVIL